MDEGGFRLEDIRPEQSIFELKFDCACDFAIALGDIKESVRHVVRDASGCEFVAFPHRSATLREPLRGLAENARNNLRISRRGLANEWLHDSRLAVCPS